MSIQTDAFFDELEKIAAGMGRTLAAQSVAGAIGGGATGVISADPGRHRRKAILGAVGGAFALPTASTIKDLIMREPGSWVTRLLRKGK